MSRFLTPARICTLVLIELYQSNDFWIYHADTCVTVLELISIQILRPAEASAVDIEGTIKPPSNVLQYAEPLAALDAELPGRSWMSILVRELWKIHTIDEFHDLFTRCMQMLISVDTLADDDLKPATVSRSSPIGQFIRRCNVEFTRIQFTDVMALWQQFAAYREPSRQMWTQQYPDAVRKAAKIAAPPVAGEVDGNALVGVDSIEAVLSASISHLQKLGQRVPSSVMQSLEEWLVAQGASKAQTLKYFMSFFDAWRAGQYNLALENLHQYFDYSIAKGTGDDMKVYYQYALLHLSVLHADFEHWEESASAMKECIATARENRDTACLNFALSWLLYLRQSRQTEDNDSLRALASLAGEGGSERDELAYLKARARESKHWTLMSNALLEEAKYELRHHGVNAKAFELVLHSSHLNTQHAASTMVPATALFQAAMFDRLGRASLARSHYRTALTVHSKHSSLADRTRIVCRLAWYSAQQGHYTEASTMLNEYRPTIVGVLRLEQRIAAFLEFVALLQALRYSALDAANTHMNKLLSIREIADPDIVRLIDTLEVQTKIKQGDLDQALAKVNGAIARASNQPDSDVAEMLSLLVQKANIFAATNRPTKGFSIAIRAASAAQNSNLIEIMIEALHSIAVILNDLNEFESARRLCDAVLSHAHAGSNPEITAQLCVTRGEAFVGMITTSNDAAEGRQADLTKMALTSIAEGRELYERIGHYEGQLDCLLMQTKLAHFAGSPEIAEQATARYHELVASHGRCVGQVYV